MDKNNIDSSNTPSGRRKLVFIILFALVGLGLQQIGFSNIIGSDISFTPYDFFAPIAGAFVGLPAGMAVVFTVSFINFAVKGFRAELAPVVRLFTNLFAVYYFSLTPSQNASKKIIAVPILAIAAFWLNPVGRAAWYYALFWTIPVLAFFNRKVLLLRSLGATFTAHAVGGVAWIWVAKFPATFWTNLVPIVAMERSLFAIGISVSYVLVTNALALLTSRNLFPVGLRLEEAYYISSSFNVDKV